VRTLLLTNCDVDRQPACALNRSWTGPGGVYPDLLLEPLVESTMTWRLSLWDLGGMCYSNPAHLTDVALLSVSGAARFIAERMRWSTIYPRLCRQPSGGIAPLLKKPLPRAVVWGMSDQIFSTQHPGLYWPPFPASPIRRIPRPSCFSPRNIRDHRGRSRAHYGSVRDDEVRGCKLVHRERF